MQTRIITTTDLARIRNYSYGFSTIEILIAFSVGIIFLTAAMMIAFSDASLTKQVSLESGTATALDATLDNGGLYRAQNKLGDVMKTLAGNWNAGIASDDDGFFISTPTIEDISPCMKAITNATEWTSLNNRDRSITFGTAFSNMDIAEALGPGGCDPTPPSEWDNPDSFGSFDPSGIAGAGIAATALDVKTIDGHLYAFLTSQHGSAASPDFWIIDVTNPNSPQYVNSPDISNGIAWGGSHKEGANDVVVIENYGYVLRNYKINQLQVIDLTNPANPTMVGTGITLPSVNQNGTDPQGEVIKYYNGKLYIGLHDTQGPELLVYNIASTPSTPTYVGAISNGFNHSITDITFSGNYAYLAIKPGTGSGAQNTKELMVIDISSTNPTDTGSGYNANIGSSDTAGAMSLYLLGNKLYMGREKVNAPKQDFYIFNISNASTPTLLASANLNQQNGSAIQTLHVTSNLAFLGLTKNPEFQVWDISNPNSISSYGCGGFDFPQEVTDVAYANNYVFAAIRSNDFFRVLHDETSDATCN
jgi:hypothetical protein